MIKSGVKITEEERKQVEVANQTSGMFLSGGTPIGNPGLLVAELVRKYHMEGYGLYLATGEFVKIE